MKTASFCEISTQLIKVLFSFFCRLKCRFILLNIDVVESGIYFIFLTIQMIMQPLFVYIFILISQVLLYWEKNIKYSSHQNAE